MRAVLFAAIASIGLVGCVGELDTTGGGDNTGGDNNNDNDNGGTQNPDSSAARKAYDDNVHSIMAAKCIACHNVAGPVSNLSGFVHSDASKAWETITGFQSVVGNFTPTLAGVLIKVDIPAGHQGQSYTSDEKNKITDWLNEEVLWRNQTPGGTDPGPGTGGGETPAQATQRVLAEWSACMTKANFDAANMASAWGNLTANNNQRCSNCHASGDGGFIATVQSQIFFDVISQNKYFMLQYFTVKLDLANLAESKVEINRQSFLGVSQGQDPHREHPRFNATNNNGMTALTNFYNRTMEAYNNSATTPCGPSKLTN
jgi:mono/diheme cytochrome c family protein